VLCNPRDGKGNNSPPNKEEVRNCSLYLSILIDIIEPEVIVPLGLCALRSLYIIRAHQLELRYNVREPVKWGKYTVVPMYHPSPRTAIYRHVSDQTEDFSFLGEMLGHQGICSPVSMKFTI
jgi:uracil-DNA glycosylase family 4